MAPAHQYQPPSVTAATIKPAASTTSVMASPSRHHRGNPELTMRAYLGQGAQGKAYLPLPGGISQGDPPKWCIRVGCTNDRCALHDVGRGGRRASIAVDLCRCISLLVPVPVPSCGTGSGLFGRCADPQPIPVEVPDFDFSRPWGLFDGDAKFSGDGLDVTDSQIYERVGSGVARML
jgi:hypothetical protein